MLQRCGTGVGSIALLADGDLSEVDRGTGTAGWLIGVYLVGSSDGSGQAAWLLLV